MSDVPVYHHSALGIHPGAYYQHDAPTPRNNGDLWIDTSSGPPFALKVWDVESEAWLAVAVVGAGTGVDPSGTVAVTCLTFPLGAQVCNSTAGELHYLMPLVEHVQDGTGYTIPGGHRLETYVEPAS
jgi:hypothetical protein